MNIFSKDMYDTYEYDTAKYRSLLEKWSPKLHPNHFQVDVLKQIDLITNTTFRNHSNLTNLLNLNFQVLLLKKRLAISMNGTLSFDQVKSPSIK